MEPSGSGTWEQVGLAPWVEPAYRRVQRLLPGIPLLAFMAAYAFHFSEVSVDTLRGYGTPAFDFGIFDQGVWLLSRFKDPFVTVMGRNLFGDHMSLILCLVAPLYWIYPHGSSLLVLQSIAIALGAVPIFLIVRHFRGGVVVATGLAGAYLLNPAVQQITLEGFHPECFLPFFLGMALYAAISWKRGLLVCMLALALLVKEDVGLIVVPIGLWVTFRRDRRLGLGIAATGAVWSIVMPLAVMPAILGFFSPSDQGKIPFGGVSGFIHTLAPAKMWHYLTAQGRPFYVWQMLIPTSFTFLFAPEIAATASVALAGNLLSLDPYEQQIVYHYSLAPEVILIVGSAFAIARWRNKVLQWMATAAVVSCSVTACLLWGALPWSDHPPIVPAPSTQTQANNLLVSMVPPDAVVSADTYFVAHLDDRTQVYLWPTPFRTGNYGSFRQDNQRLPVASKIQYLLLDVPPTSQNLATLQGLERSFHLVRLDGDAALFERDRLGPLPPSSPSGL